MEHFLSAFKLQQDSRGPQQGEGSVMSDSIWNTLRMALTLMGRSDMHEACDKHDLDILLKEFPLHTWSVRDHVMVIPLLILMSQCDSWLIVYGTFQNCIVLIN